MGLPLSNGKLKNFTEVSACAKLTLNDKDSKNCLIQKKAVRKRKRRWRSFLFFLTALSLGGLFLFQWNTQVQASVHNTSNLTGALINPALTPTIIPTPTPIIISDTDYGAYYYHSWDIPEEVSGINDFWIEVDLSEQMLFVYRGDQIINSFLVSTGTNDHPTVTGAFKIYAKHFTYTMAGPGYHLPDVPYSLFFHKGYSIHGTYWHSNFGTPMSHGCVNMDTEDAAWIYNQATIGTYVFVHY